MRTEIVSSKKFELFISSVNTLIGISGRVIDFYETRLLLCLILIVLIQLLVIFSQGLSFIILILLILISTRLFLTSQESIRREILFITILVLLAYLSLYFKISNDSDLNEALAYRNMPFEPEHFHGVVVEDSAYRKKGFISVVAIGKLHFYNRNLKLKIWGPDVPWRSESSFKKGDKIQCGLLLPENLGSNFSNILSRIQDDVDLDTSLLKNRDKEYNCSAVSNSQNKSGLVDELFIRLSSNKEISQIGLGVLFAATLGRGEYLESWIKELFKHTGLYHLLVVSGYHLGVVLLLALYLVHSIIIYFPAILSYSTRSNYVVLAAWLFTFIFIALGRLKPPLLRASLMMFVFSLSKLLERRSGIIKSILYSLIALNISWPLCILSPGVQMSYLALSGVLVGLKLLSKYESRNQKSEMPFNVNEYKGIKKKRKFGFILQLLAVSTGAYLFVLPIQYLWFESVAPYSIIFNIVFAPIFSLFVVAGGMILIVTSIIGIPGSEYLLELHTQLTEYLVLFIERMYLVIS